jgi:hypothetical protein
MTRSIPAPRRRRDLERGRRPRSLVCTAILGALLLVPRGARTFVPDVVVGFERVNQRLVLNGPNSLFRRGAFCGL